MSVALFDFTDLEVFTDDVPHEALAQLRRDSPVYWNQISNSVTPDDGFWLITRHEDIVQIEKNPTLFSSHHGLTLANAPPPMCGPPWSMVRDGLTHLDPPDHAVHRQLVAPLVAPRAIEALEDRIRAIAIEVLDRACKLRYLDFASEVALRFPVAVVLGELLGLPEEDFARIVYWNDVIFAPKDPDFPKSAGVKVVHDVYNYARSILAARRRDPKKDVLSLLSHAKDANGASMSDEMFVRYFWSLVTGAFDTTASVISGGMLALLKFPEQHGRLFADPSIVPTAVEEMLRWETPIIYFRRTAMTDTEIRGRKILRGQRVLLCYASANRDEGFFANPGIFDVTRNPNDHLSFGRGPHFCLGASLARVEIRIMFEQLIGRQVHIELHGAIRRARSNFQNRIKRMPVAMYVR